jgi:AmmeMemoRadiSam system protein B
MIRKATHAGSWYNGSKESLEKQISNLFKNSEFGPSEEPKSLNLENRTAIGGLSPHAGYRYSGRCAAHTYLELFKEKIPDTIIILGTIHVRYDGVAIYREGEWETPLGNVEVDAELADSILSNSKIIQDDYSAFIGYYAQEHNIEIQLPFIKYCAKDKPVKILPLKLGYRSLKDYGICEKIAEDLATSINSSKKDVIIVASSDMQHEEIFDSTQLERFKEKDDEVINAFCQLDAKKLYNIATKLSICGPQTITTLILTCKKLNGKQGKLLKHYTSCDSEKSFGYCVGYFSGIIIK